MLASFLRDTYKSNIVTKQFLQNNLKNWKIAEDKLIKTFKFDDFNQAMVFTSLAADYIKQYGVNAEMY
jgi:pterin-4a-carbinolamine dehydratase